MCLVSLTINMVVGNKIFLFKYNYEALVHWPKMTEDSFVNG